MNGRRARAKPGAAAGFPVPLPAPVSLGLDATLVELWRARGAQVLFDSYAGIPLLKFPEDLRVYEHLIWAAGVSTLVELGVGGGGSALWFRDRLRTLAEYGRIRDPRVISVDLDIAGASENLAFVDPGYADTITLIEGDVRDPQIAAQVAGLVAPQASIMVVDDSAHTHETTIAALTGYCDLVKAGGWFIVEDGGVDIEEARLDPAWPRGVLAAIHEWLDTAKGQQFTMRRELELYGLTSHPEGFLQRTS